MYDRLDDLPTTPFIRPIDRHGRDHTPTVEIPVGDREPTVPDRLHTDSDTVEESLTTTLPIAAPQAYALFCDVAAVPSWMGIVRSVRIVEQTVGGLASRAAFLANLKGATIGYTLTYRYWPDRLAVAWSTASGASTLVAGRARFAPLGDSACLLHYELQLELPEGALPAWSDANYNGHPVSAVLADFRDYVNRSK